MHARITLFKLKIILSSHQMQTTCRRKVEDRSHWSKENVSVISLRIQNYFIYIFTQIYNSAFTSIQIKLVNLKGTCPLYYSLEK